MLTDLLWPNKTENDARNNFRHSLNELQKVIRASEFSPPILEIDRDTIVFFQCQLCNVDTWDFRNLADFQRENSYLTDIGIVNIEQGISLYRGEFLEGFHVDDSTQYQDWLLARRETYRELMLESLHKLSNAYIHNKQFSKALIYARRQVEIEPWCEEARQQIMRALALDGRRSEALAQYSICRDLMIKELGVEPGKKTFQLYLKIRDDTLTLESCDLWS